MTIAKNLAGFSGGIIFGGLALYASIMVAMSGIGDGTDIVLGALGLTTLGGIVVAALPRLRNYERAAGLGILLANIVAVGVTYYALSHLKLEL